MYCILVPGRQMSLITRTMASIVWWWDLMVDGMIKLVHDTFITSAHFHVRYDVICKGSWTNDFLCLNKARLTGQNIGKRFRGHRYCTQATHDVIVADIKDINKSQVMILKHWCFHRGRFSKWPVPWVTNYQNARIMSTTYQIVS